MVARPRVVLLHSNPKFSRRIVNSLARYGYDVLRAIGRADGLPLIYQIRPDLILLEVASTPAGTSETVSNIRLMTDTPILLLASRAINPPDLSVAACSQLITPPLTVPRIAAAIKLSLNSSVITYAKSREPLNHATIVSEDEWRAPDQLIWLQSLLPRLRNAEPPDESIYHVILNNVLATMHSDWAALYLPEVALVQSMRVISRHAVDVDEWTHAQRQFLDTQVAEALKCRRTVVQAMPVSGNELRSRSGSHPEGFGGAVFVPLVGRDRVHGVLVAVNRAAPGKRFTSTLVRFATTTGEALAMALDSRPTGRPGTGTANLDAITGLYTQAFAERAISMERQWCLRYGHEFSVVQLNWENRQQFLQVHGSREYLSTWRYIADLCQRSVRASDIVARCADETIAFVLPEVDGRIAEMVVSRLEKTLDTNFADVPVEDRPRLVARVLPRPEAALFGGAAEEISAGLLVG